MTTATTATFDVEDACARGGRSLTRDSINLISLTHTHTPQKTTATGDIGYVRALSCTPLRRKSDICSSVINRIVSSPTCFPFDIVNSGD